MWFINQIGDTPGENNGSVANIACKDIDLPANGECTEGWMYTDSNDWVVDPTVAINCRGRFFLLNIIYIYIY